MLHGGARGIRIWSRAPRAQEEDMTQSEAPARRSLFARRDRSAPSGPRATVRQLVPYLLEHKGIIAFAIVLSLLLAAASLAQPLVVGQVISLVESGQALGGLIWLLVLLVVAQGILSGYQHYLL